MELRAKLSSVDGKAPGSRDGPNRIGLKFSPMFLADDDASWLFEHLGQYLSVSIEVKPPPLTPMETAIASAQTPPPNGEVHVPDAGRRRNRTRSSEQA